MAADRNGWLEWARLRSTIAFSIEAEAETAFDLAEVLGDVDPVLDANERLSDAIGSLITALRQNPAPPPLRAVEQAVAAYLDWRYALNLAITDKLQMAGIDAARDLIDQCADEGQALLAEFQRRLQQTG